MNTTRLRSTVLVGLVLLLAAGVAWGQPDFSRYVAMGDSLTAGFTSGGLVESAQLVSYPARIKAQGSGSASGFEQPLVSEPGIPPLLELRSLINLTIAPKDGFGSPLNLFLERPYDNIAVPGADSTDLVSTVTDGGGLHDLILRGLGTQLQQGLALAPTFVTLWIGNNDALGAAVSGIVIDDVTLTRLPVFEANFRIAAGAIAASGAGMAFATIPDVTAIPYVSTIPPVVVDPATNQPVIIGGAPVPIIGPDGPLSLADKVLLPASALLAQGIGIPAALGGTGQGLPDSAVLDAGEIAQISDRIAGFNSVIRQVASETGAALVDVNGIFADIHANGLVVGGIELTTGFLTGGLFSYDGVHATALGYAIVANAFIDAINTQLGGSISPVPLADVVFGTRADSPPDPGSFVFHRKAEKNLREVLDIPSDKKLRRLKRKLGRP